MTTDRFYQKTYTALQSRLTGGTALTALLSGGTVSVFQGEAPENYTLPYVLFSHQGGGIANECPSEMYNILLYVRGYASTINTAEQIDSEVKALLHNQALTVSGWTNYMLMRETDVQITEEAPGGKVYSFGGVYRFKFDS